MKQEYENIDVKNEKVDRIIRAAFEVFALNDLEKASTNSVVKLAGISRGLLYHYFKDKQDLFDFLIYFSIKEIVINMQEKLDWEDTDFLNRIRQAIAHKFDVMGRYPYMMDFFDKYSREMSNVGIRNQVEQIAPGITDKIYTHNLDFSQIKPGVDKDKMIRVVRYSLSGIILDRWTKARAKGEYISKDEILSQCDEYIQFFRAQFYN